MKAVRACSQHRRAPSRWLPTPPVCRRNSPFVSLQFFDDSGVGDWYFDEDLIAIHVVAMMVAIEREPDWLSLWVARNIFRAPAGKLASIAQHIRMIHPLLQTASAVL